MDTTQGQNKRFVEFKNILKDIDTLSSIDEANFDTYYKKRGFSNFGYLESFIDELNYSFLSNVNKEDTLKYYLFELNFWNNEFVVNNNDLIFQKKNEGTNLSFREKSIIESYDIFDIVLTEITLCCSKYNLNFYKICDEINFDYSFTDTGLIEVFNNENTENQKIDSIVKLTMSQIALKRFYEVGTLTREEAKDLIIGTGHASGDALYGKFCKYAISANRKGNPQNSTKLRNMIKLLESVIKLLPENKAIKAKSELNMLKIHLI